jgi:hypothetical protein
MDFQACEPALERLLNNGPRHLSPLRLPHSPAFHLLLDIAKPIQKKIMPKIAKSNITAGGAPTNASNATIPTRTPPNTVNARPDPIPFYLLYP